MNKFLTQLGQIALKGLGVLIPGFGNMNPSNITTTVTTIEDALTKIRTVIQEVEVMGQALSLPGPQKLTAATPLIADVLLKSSAFAGHKIENPDLFKAGCGKIGSGMADVLNSLNADNLTSAAG